MFDAPETLRCFLNMALDAPVLILRNSATHIFAREIIT